MTNDLIKKIKVEQMKNKTKFKVNSIVRYNLDYIKTYSPYLETTCKSLSDFIKTDPVGRINNINNNHVSVQWYVTDHSQERVTVQPKEWLILEELTPPSPTGNGVLYKEYIKSNKHKMNNKKQTTFKKNDRVQYIPILQNGFIIHINKSNPKHPLYTIFSRPINSDMIAQALKDNSAYQNVAEQAPAPSKDDEPKIEEVQVVKNRLISYLVDRIVFYRDERGVSISDFAKMLDELYLLAEVFGITKEVVAGVQEKDMLSRSS